MRVCVTSSRCFLRNDAMTSMHSAGYAYASECVMCVCMCAKGCLHLAMAKAIVSAEGIRKQSLLDPELLTKRIVYIGLDDR